MDALLLRTADRHLRRKFANDIPGLTAFADGVAAEVTGSAVTITSSSTDASAATGQLTMPREVWLLAAENLLANPLFNPSAPPRLPRVAVPDYRFITP